MIFNIQRYSTHDGDGVRTLIFYKGCPLRCEWCSNPESQSYNASVLYDQKSCKHFGDCALEAPGAISFSADSGLQIKRELIPDPDKMRDVCAARALTISGEELSSEELLAEVRKDLPFYGNDGGVTLSGGEPLAQDGEFVHFLQALHKEQIATNVETSLHVKWALVERTIGLIRTYLVDLKHTDPLKFKQFTHGDAALVLENLERLTYFGTHVVVRIPVIPGFNHSEGEIRMMVDRVSSIKGIEEIHFLPYHTFGVEKYAMLGKEYTFNSTAQVREEELLPYVQYAESKGFATKIGG
jgi:pyruvate formate lyase activating enzyme